MFYIYKFLWIHDFLNWNAKENLVDNCFSS